MTKEYEQGYKDCLKRFEQALREANRIVDTTPDVSGFMKGYNHIISSSHAIRNGITRQ